MRSTNSYRIRSFEPGNQAEIERMNLMFYHPQVLKFMGYKKSDVKPIRYVNLQSSNRDMFNASPVVRREYSEVCYAVADTKNHLVGWVWFSHDARHPLPQRIATRFGLTPRNSRQYELIFQKLLSEGWPQLLIDKVIHVHPKDLRSPRKGVIVEGLRLAMARLKRSYSRLYARKRKLALYAYVVPRNIASQKVLLKNGFAQESRTYLYDGVSHELWVRII